MAAKAPKYETIVRTEGEKVFFKELFSELFKGLKKYYGEDEAKTILTKSKKTIKKSHFNSGQKSFKHGPITTNGEKVDSIPEKLYNNCNEVKLDKAALQDFFAYEALNVVDKNFRIKKKKKNDEFEVDFDEDIDVAKPIPGKTEIMVYDR